MTEGLQVDLRRLMAQRQAANTTQPDSPQQGRRRLLGWLPALGGLSTWALIGCGGGGDSASSTAAGTTGNATSSTGTGTGTATTTGTDGVSTCSVINEETAGPYPGDGSNTASGSIANALALSGIVRSDIRSSVASATGTATGVPMTVRLKLVNVNNSCGSLEGYAIYLWHCTSDGKYSMYSSGVTDQNYLRGVQATDSDGVATFLTIFPGCYSGRMPHMHFEVYRSLTSATSYSNKLKTSQLAFPLDTCQSVYNNANGYSASISNLAAISFATDNVFSDGVTLEMTSVTGNLSDGYVATITVGISA